MTQKPSNDIYCKLCVYDLCAAWLGVENLFSKEIFLFVSIQRYSVIPLSPNSGLIGWVPHCDTLHTLFKEYREKKKIMLNIEHRLMLQVNTHTSF